MSTTRKPVKRRTVQRRAAGDPLSVLRAHPRAAAVLFLAVLILGGLFFFLNRPSTLPEKVQSEMPSWVTQRLLTPNPYSRPQIEVPEVNAIVIHYVGNPGTSAAANRSFFENLATTGETHASSNFIVGLEGEILQCVPVSEMAYCSSNRNGDTVSIEVCHPDAEGQFTEKTMASLVRLTAWLCDAFSLTEEDVIRHYDVTGKECPLYYVRHPDAWDAFRAEVRAALSN